MNNEYMSLKELSDYSRLHTNLLRSWVKEGMPHFRIGRRIRVKRSEFDAWMEKKFRTKGTAEDRFKAAILEAKQEVLQ
jgi:excisionase family DNA binding protein